MLVFRTSRCREKRSILSGTKNVKKTQWRASDHSIYFATVSRQAAKKSVSCLQLPLDGEPNSKWSGIIPATESWASARNFSLWGTSNQHRTFENACFARSLQEAVLDMASKRDWRGSSETSETYPVELSTSQLLIYAASCFHGTFALPTGWLLSLLLQALKELGENTRNIILLDYIWLHFILWVPAKLLTKNSTKPVTGQCSVITSNAVLVTAVSAPQTKV